jgi:hypothetical protein
MKPVVIKSFVMRWISLLALALLASVLMASCGGNSGNPPVIFTATLTGAEETPPNNSTGQGVGILLFQPNTRQFSASLVSTGVADTAAHIHEAAPGVAGPIIFPLNKESGSVVWTASGTLTLAQEQTLRTGNYYFNVHSPTFPSGEIRGQIVLKSLTQQQLEQLRQLRQQSQQLDQALQAIEQQQQGQ